MPFASPPVTKPDTPRAPPPAAGPPPATRPSTDSAPPPFPVAIPEAAGSTDGSINGSESGNSSSGLPIGAIVGIAVGGAVIVAAAAGLGYWRCRREQRRQAASAACGDVDAAAPPSKVWGDGSLDWAKRTGLAC